MFKVIVIGDPVVGKTSLLTKFSANKFEEQYVTTVGVNIVKVSISLEPQNITVK